MTIFDLPEDKVHEFFSKKENKEIYAAMLYYQQMAYEYNEVGDEAESVMCQETSHWLACYLQYLLFEQSLGGMTTIAQSIQGVYKTLLETVSEYMPQKQEIYDHYKKRNETRGLSFDDYMEPYEAGFLDAITNVGGENFLKFLQKMDENGTSDNPENTMNK